MTSNGEPTAIELDRMRQARDLIFSVVDQHERSQRHICWSTRASVLAFIAHALGFRSDDDAQHQLIRSVMAEYEAHCPKCQQQKPG